MTSKKIYSNRGYTLLFAVLTASLVLGVAVFIVNISRKQYELSVSARNSIYAFYAADAGIECAVNPASWANSNAGNAVYAGTYASSSVSNILTCGGSNVTLTLVDPYIISPANVVTVDDLDPNNIVRQQEGWVHFTTSGGQAGSCMKLSITTGDNPRDNRPITIIDSRGYNHCTTANGVTSPDAANPGTVERALRLTQYGIW